MRLESGALSADDFPAFANDYVLFCHVTTRIPDHPYDRLLGEKGGTGFPYVAFLNANGDVLTPHKGQRTVAGFAETGRKAIEFLELHEKAAAGDDAAKIELLVAGARMGVLAVDAAKAQRAELDELMSDEQKATVDAAIFDLEVSGMYDAARRTRDPAKMAELAGKFYEMFKEGQRSSGRDADVRYLPTVMQGAAEAGDAETFEACLNAVKALGRIRPQWITQQEATLQRLKAGSGE